MRIVLAVFIAPFAILPLIVVFAMLTDFESIGNAAYWEWLQMFAAFGLVIAFPSTLVVGLPAYFLMLHFGKASFALFGAAGAVISTAGVLLFFEPLRDANNAGFVVLIIASGAAVAVAFRGIAGAPGR
ncbi:MAG: hypothetical protein HKM98_02750 [Gammaproteobacteria bacterium]|nr:hypothetical protein [Gammaproteobacteria bacterium]